MIVDSRDRAHRHLGSGGYYYTIGYPLDGISIGRNEHPEGAWFSNLEEAETALKLEQKRIHESGVKMAIDVIMYEPVFNYELAEKAIRKSINAYWEETLKQRKGKS